jgi:hypothetical protein
MSNLLNPFRVDAIGVIPQDRAAKNAALTWALSCCPFRADAFDVVAGGERSPGRMAIKKEPWRGERALSQHAGKFL